MIIAVLLASLFPENRVLPWNNSCLHARTVRADTHGMSAVPLLVLWAWERPEDLRFLDPIRVGVAFLAATVRLWAEGSELPSPDAAAPGGSGNEFGSGRRTHAFSPSPWTERSLQKLLREIR